MSLGPHFVTNPELPPLMSSSSSSTQCLQRRRRRCCLSHASPSSASFSSSWGPSAYDVRKFSPFWAPSPLFSFSCKIHATSLTSSLFLADPPLLRQMSYVEGPLWVFAIVVAVPPFIKRASLKRNLERDSLEWVLWNGKSFPGNLQGWDYRKSGSANKNQETGSATKDSQRISIPVAAFPQTF